MTGEASRWGMYRHLDASPALQASVAWLDRVACLAPVRAGKQLSYELLGVGPGDHVLDVGCGTGVDIPAIAPMLAPGGEIVGVDSSAGVLAQAELTAAQAGVAARFEQADAGALPFDDDCFDACRCDRTIQHLPDPHGALREMVRVTRPGGTVVISESRNRVVDAEGSSLPLLEKILALHQTHRERAGWIGAMLPLLLSQAGSVGVRMEKVEGRLVVAEDITTFYDLRELTARAVEAGQMTPDGASDLHEAVKRETAAGRLSVVVETYVFAGGVPGAARAS